VRVILFAVEIPESEWLKWQPDGLALQLLFCFEVRSLSERLVSSTPE